ncbi:crAss001_48 related protein [Mycobacterium avium]|uniref:crAss001_48 related protein n=1 Tax=Mycobacterium avium TaxID=1764 RepID=UPI000CE37E7D|nr:hypothetical protein [Mycobacterium avium]
MDVATFERMVTELRLLDERIGRLESFTHPANSKFTHLEPSDQELLAAQLAGMTAYRAALAKRITRAARSL